MDWLKSNYPNNHRIVIDTNGAELVECGKLNVIDNDLKEAIFGKPCMSETSKEEIQKILNMDTSKIQNNLHRFSVEMLQKAFKDKNGGN